MTIEQLRECFDGVQPRPGGKRGFICDCPICHKPLTVCEYRGMIMLVCSAGCREADIRRRLGIVLGDLFNGREAPIHSFFARSMGLRFRNRSREAEAANE